MVMDYRLGGPADAPAVAALFEASFVATFGHLYAAEDLAAFLGQFGAERWAAELADPDLVFHIAEHAGRIVGYAKVGPPSLPVEVEGPALELRQLYLLTDAQGSGAGQALLDRVFATAAVRGAAAVILSVYIDNHRARRFYERNGFERVGRYVFMVGSHADEDDLMVRVAVGLPADAG
ncbi:GNAT family N-acetyltransferase [Sphingomonas montana]|uniref:GNAT family N-acetyltransferase n=1 Tax=Sphingomonas montana TaxID=1843236 RepID=UPI001F0A5ED6|nr:GNAT family N-acetyltransferase [Sphingomonas montana]